VKPQHRAGALTTGDLNVSDMTPPPPPPPSGPPVPPPMSGGAAGRPAGAPKDYFVLAIVGTILGACGCITLITGILGIVNANKVRKCIASGDMAGAERASNTAKIFVIITWALLVLSWIVWIIMAATGRFSTS
jgi:hypothetical protein